MGPEDLLLQSLELAGISGNFIKKTVFGCISHISSLKSELFFLKTLTIENL